MDLVVMRRELEEGRTTSDLDLLAVMRRACCYRFNEGEIPSREMRLLRSFQRHQALSSSRSREERVRVGKKGANTTLTKKDWSR